MSGYDKQLYMVLQNAIEIAKECGLKPGEITSVKVNGRLSRALGRCRQSRDYRGFHIEINKKVAEKCDYRFIMQTMLHEVVHTCDGCWNHGEGFKSAARKIMAKYPEYDIQRTNNPVKENSAGDSYLRSYKYLVRCSKCGEVVGKDRMCDFVKYPKLYRHIHCGGTFERIK